ncbi:MAG: non-homologous end-joining DNA ligase, partial [Gemmatimonadaceae bacterium]
MPDDLPQAPPADNLAQYRAKRSADRSPEPVGTVSTVPGRLFVVHKHAARQLHFDLRLEMDGVLRSWAVPRGPSYDQADKRLAVKVEDHPLEYGDFEGVIPEGNYGAGGVIVWDRGEWVPIEDWREGLEKGKLLFELKGYKLKGTWTLVKIKKSERDWLLIKERDAHLKSPGDQFPEESVLSGLTVEEVKTGRSDASALRKEIEAVARPGPVQIQTAQVMLTEPRDDAFTREGWVFELKMDGYRMLAGKSKGEVQLVTRNGNDYTRVFPEITKAMRALPFEQFVIDGEIVVLDSQGKPGFALLQKRGSLTNETDIRRMAVELPTTFFVFDLLGFEQMDLRELPLVARKDFLQRAVPPVGPVRFLEHIPTQGEAMLAQVGTLGLEGIIAKKADAPYKAGRTNLWYKIKAQRSADFVIVGFTAPQGHRAGFGALQIADYVDGKLVYAGRAGTGFGDKQLKEYHKMLSAIVRPTPPCFGPVKAPGAEPLPSEAIPETSTTTWVEPVYVCEVRYTEWTPDGILRHPAFLRLRDDKRAHECERQGWSERVRAHAGEGQAGDGQAGERVSGSAGQDLDREPALPPRVVQKTVNISNPRKVFWPDEKYTKGD